VPSVFRWYLSRDHIETADFFSNISARMPMPHAVAADLGAQPRLRPAYRVRVAADKRGKRIFPGVNRSAGGLVKGAQRLSCRLFHKPEKKPDMPRQHF
jgi:hypothetical protein